MWGKSVQALVLVLTVGMLASSCSSDTSEGVDADAEADAATTAIESEVDESEATTTTSATDEGDPDDAPPAGSSECTVVITGDREETWNFEAGTNNLGIATDYWFSDETQRAAVEELGGSYEEFVEKGDPLVAFLGVYCSESDDAMEPGRGANVGAADATRATDLPMAPGIYPIVGGGTVSDEAPAGTMTADLAMVDDEIYETIVDSGSLEIDRWDNEGIEGSFSFAALEMFSEDPKEIDVTIQFSVACQTPPYDC